MMLLGPTYELYKMDSTDDKNSNRNMVISPADGIDETTAFSSQSYVGGKLSIIADTRDHLALPGKGIFWQATVRHLAGTNDASYDVTQLNSDFVFYLSLPRKTFVLVNRTGAGHNFGDFEFYQAQYLGNEDHLRGYHKNRFAGHTKFYNNTELRIRLANFRTYLFPGSLGLLGFYDTGRIWADNDDSKKWLSGYGAGIWISPLSRVVLTATYAMSKETSFILVALGWKF
jgi:outer membrane protein assembly factor BamA